MIRFIATSSALFVAALAGLTALAVQAQSLQPAEALYREHCAACHGADRLGGTGPALIRRIPETARGRFQTHSRSVTDKGTAVSCGG